MCYGSEVTAITHVNMQPFSTQVTLISKAKFWDIDCEATDLTQTAWVACNVLPRTLFGRGRTES